MHGVRGGSDRERDDGGRHPAGNTAVLSSVQPSCWGQGLDEGTDHFGQGFGLFDADDMRGILDHFIARIPNELGHRKHQAPGGVEPS